MKITSVRVLKVFLFILRRILENSIQVFTICRLGERLFPQLDLIRLLHSPSTTIPTIAFVSIAVVLTNSFIYLFQHEKQIGVGKGIWQLVVSFFVGNALIAISVTYISNWLIAA